MGRQPHMFDLGPQIISSACLWEFSARLFPCHAAVARVRVSDSQILSTPVIFGFFETSWRFLQISLSTGMVVLFVCPWQRGVACCARVGKFSSIVEAHGFATVLHVVWPVHSFFMHCADGTGGMVLLRQ